MQKKIVGIVAEYNPFHKGHAYHIRKAKEISGADYAVVVMSGNFTQRGTPAILDKFTRTRMALSCGADLVLELPVRYACASAEYFASGAAAILDRLGCVDALCFGSECGSAESLMQAAAALEQFENTPKFRETLKEQLKKGLSFPAARSAALQCCQEKAVCEDALFSLPNNILGIEYCRALLRRNSSIRPVTIPRKGGYHDTALVSDEETFASASAIRQAIAQNTAIQTVPAEEASVLQKYIFPAVPSETVPLWERILSFSRHSPEDRSPSSASFGMLTEQDFSALLHYRLLSCGDSAADSASDGFLPFADVTPDLSDKLRKNLYAFTDWDSFCRTLNSRDLTYTRISRVLAHILLDIRAEGMTACKESGFPGYARILGFRKEAAPLLSHIKQAILSQAALSIPDDSTADSLIPPSSACLFSSPADGLKQLDGIPRELLQEEIRASHIYRSVLSHKYQKPFCNEYQQQIVILP